MTTNHSALEELGKMGAQIVEARVVDDGTWFRPRRLCTKGRGRILEVVVRF